jgi:hypothetical protein
VQYVPHAFGWKAANLPFCFWLRSRRRDSVWIMFHEVAYPRGTAYSLAENVLAFVTRWMAAIAARRAERIFVSIPGWRPLVASAVGTTVPLEWLPIPNSVPVVDDGTGCRYGSGCRKATPSSDTLAYGRLIRSMLRSGCRSPGRDRLPGAAARPRRRPFKDELIAAHSGLPAASTTAAGVRRLVAARQRMRPMLQPYPDGVSSRRTS